MENSKMKNVNFKLLNKPKNGLNKINFKEIINTVIILILLSILFLTIYSRFINKNDLIQIFNRSILVVLTGSMEPNIKSGELIIIHRQKEYCIGDVITYKDEYNDFITHRIVSLPNDLLVITQGDNNNISDEPININQIQGKVIYHSKVLGFFVLYLLKPITLITFSGNSNSYNYNIDQFKSSNINSGGTTLVSGAFEKLKIYFSQFSKKTV
jgi:signal peptidase